MVVLSNRSNNEEQGLDEMAREDGAWHLDKKLNVGHLLTTLTLAGALVSWGGAMDRRIAVLEEKAATYQVEQRRQDEQLKVSIDSIRDEFRSLREDLREHTRKLDRIVENGNGYPRRAAP